MILDTNAVSTLLFGDPGIAEVREKLRRRGRPLPKNDFWIGALLIQHGLPIVSADSELDAIDGVMRVGWESEKRAPS